MRTPVARAPGCAIAAMALLLAHETACAQRAQAQARPGWLTREVRTIANLTPAQNAAAMARLEQIERLLLRIPELAQPQGFEVWPSFVGGARILHPDETQHDGDVVQYDYWLTFFAPSYAIATTGRRCIEISINPRLDSQHTSFRDVRGHPIYLEPGRGTPVPLATQVYGSYDASPDHDQTIDVLFTSGPELPWRQVTRAEFFDASLLSYEGRDGAELAGARRSLQKTPYALWLEGAAERAREREQTLKALVGIQSAAEIAALRKQLEDTEREIGENLKNSEAEDRAANQKAAEMFAGIRDSIIAERNRMSPAERRMPALIDTRGNPVGATGRALADSDDPTAWRVLTPNYDFWRARRSPDEVRAINVRLQSQGTCSDPAVKRALWQVYQKLDWAALNRMLAVPRPS